MHGTFCTVLKTSEAALIFLPGFLVLPTDKPRFPFCLSTEIDGILYSGQMPLLSAHFVSFGNSSLAHLLWENQFFQPQLVRFLRATHHSSPQTWPWNCTYTRTESHSLLSQDCSEKLTHRADTRTLSCSVGQPIMPTCEPKRERGRHLEKRLDTHAQSSGYCDLTRLPCEFLVPATMHSGKQKTMARRQVP